MLCLLYASCPVSSLIERGVHNESTKQTVFDLSSILAKLNFISLLWHPQWKVAKMGLLPGHLSALPFGKAHLVSIPEEDDWISRDCMWW
jgi:hypothetical protein